MKKLILFNIILFIWLTANAQSSVVGNVKDDEVKPIPFASLGYYQKKAGGITDVNGNFSIARYSGDSIKISAIGFESKNISIDTSKSFLGVILNRKPQILTEVTVESRRKTTEKLSLGYFGLDGRTFTDRGNLEVQQAYFIPNESRINGYIEEVKFKLRELTDKNLSLRIRLITVDSVTGLPGIDLLQDNYIIMPSQLKRNTIVNIKKLNIKLPKDGVFVSLEWLCLEEKCKNISGTEIPSMPGGIATTKNARYLNYKELIWVATPFQVNDAYATAAIGITVTY